MTGQPKFSIVTITLNCASAALETARSVLAQDFQAYEYIIKDGGSTDGTLESLKALGLNVISSLDKGIYDAMNQALDLCCGEYVYFLNAGDTFSSTKVLSNIASRIEPATEVCYGDVLFLPINKIQAYPKQISRYYLFRKNICHQALIIKRALYLSSGKFDISFHYVADQALLWKTTLGKKRRTQHVPLVIANFQLGGASTRQANENAVASERWKLIKQYFTTWEILMYGLLGLYFLNPLKAWIWYQLYPQLKE